LIPASRPPNEHGDCEKRRKRSHTGSTRQERRRNPIEKNDIENSEPWAFVYLNCQNVSTFSSVVVLGMIEIQSFEVFGNPNAEAKKALSGFGASFNPSIGGFTR